MSLGSAARHAKHRLMLARRDAAQVMCSTRLLCDPAQYRIRTAVRRGMQLPPMPAHRRVRGSVWAVAMVRNEADIIADVVEHLFRQGVDRALVMDNMSTDETRSLLSALAGDYPLYVGDDMEKAYFQPQKMTYLARRAAAAGADWIVPFDADEFWFAPGGPLAHALRRARSPIAVASVHNAFPNSDPRVPGTWRVDSQPARLQKVAFRWHPLAQLHHGNHAVTRPGQPVHELRIMHYPWRSREQFIAKLTGGSAALDATGRPRDTGGGDHWRDVGRLPADELVDRWLDVLAGRTDEALEWTPRGRLVSCEPRAWSRWDPGGVLSTADPTME
jgi:hypothetical protein